MNRVLVALLSTLMLALPAHACDAHYKPGADVAQANAALVDGEIALTGTESALSGQQGMPVLIFPP